MIKNQFAFQHKKLDKENNNKKNTFKYFTIVYTCLTPRVKLKYSQACSYACQGGSMLRNLSIGSVGTMSYKLFI